MEGRLDMKTQWILPIFCIVMIFFPTAHTRTAAKPAAVPVILDTDIGDDIDDTWALALLLKSPELDLKLVVTDQGKPVYRAKIVARLLEIAGRTDVPIGLGLPVIEGTGGQAPWVKDYDISRYPGKVYRDGVQALIDTIMRSAVPVTLICIGPVPNIEAALEREPRIARNARFVGMDGSIRLGYDGKKRPDAEYNVKANARACRRALNASWNVTITPLDTCGLVRLDGERYASVRDCRDPLVKAVIENYRIWLGKDRDKAETASSTLFDTVAVFLAMSEDVFVMEHLGIRVTDDGFTIIDTSAKRMNCATGWKDMELFKTLLVRRLVSG
jgi:inosine-uridine nucleoside N-ribohydrolase